MKKADRGEVVRLVQGCERLEPGQAGRGRPSSIRTGWWKSGPPCTTRWPMARIASPSCASSQPAARAMAVASSGSSSGAWFCSTRSAPAASVAAEAGPDADAVDVAAQEGREAGAEDLELQAGRAGVDDEDRVHQAPVATTPIRGASPASIRAASARARARSAVVVIL